MQLRGAQIVDRPHQHLHRVRHRDLNALQRRFPDRAGQQIELLGGEVLGHFGGDLHRRDVLHDLSQDVIDAIRLGAHQRLVVAEQGPDGNQSVDRLRVGLLPFALHAEGNMYDLAHGSLFRVASASLPPQVPCLART